MKPSFFGFTPSFGYAICRLLSGKQQDSKVRRVEIRDTLGGPEQTAHDLGEAGEVLGRPGTHHTQVLEGQEANGVAGCKHRKAERWMA